MCVLWVAMEARVRRLLCLDSAQRCFEFGRSFCLPWRDSVAVYDGTLSAVVAEHAFGQGLESVHTSG